MDYKKSRMLMWTGFAVGIFVAAIGAVFENENTIDGFLVAGSVVLLVALIQAFAFYNCPCCGYSLMNVRGKIPEYCPKCGKCLKDD